MKKVLTILLLSLIMTVGMFTEETDNEYWYNEADVDGRLLTYYFCKTDAQFDNTFKHIVNEQLGITYSFREPNWNSIKSGLVSIEYIKKNFPKFYFSRTIITSIINCMADDIAESIEKYSDYKYCWCIQNICGTPFINVAEMINGTVYMSLSVYRHYQWVYTLETLAALENVL